MLALLIVSTAAASDVESKPRLALCASGGDKAEAIVALMEVALSKRDDVALLDRANVKKILSEHRVSLETELSGMDAIKTGKVLDCDIFFDLRWFLEKDGSSPAKGKRNVEAAAVVGFDTATGVCVLDAPLPVDHKADRIAAMAQDCIDTALRKWKGLSTTKTHTVSVWSAHDVGLPDRIDWVPDTVCELLRRRLINQQHIALLERKSLGLLLKEYELTGKPLENLLLSSSCLDIDVSKAEEGIKARISLSDIKGKEIDSLTRQGTVTNLNALVDDLVSGLSEKLDIRESPVGPEQLILEAKRIRMTGAGLSVVRAARTLAETAFTVKPDHSLTGPRLHRILTAEFQTEGISTDEQLDVLHRIMDVLDRMDALGVRDVHGRIPTRISVAIMQLITSTSGTWPTFESKALKLQTDEQKQRYDVFRKRVLKRYLDLPDLCGPELGFIRGLIDNEEKAMSVFLELGTRVPRYDVQAKVGFEALATSIKKVRHGKTVQCDVTGFSAKNKRKLLNLYESSWQRDERIEDNVTHSGDWRASAAMAEALLLQVDPSLVENPEKRIKKLLRRAANLAIKDQETAKTLINRLLYVEGDFLYHWRVKYRTVPPQPIQFPAEIAVPEVKRILNEFTSKKWLADNVLLFLDWHDSENAEHPGAYIETAISQLKNENYQGPARYSRLRRLKLAEKLTSIHKLRYGRSLDPKAESEAPCLTTAQKIYDCTDAKDFLDAPGEGSSVKSEDERTRPLSILAAKHRDGNLFLLIGRVRQFSRIAPVKDNIRTPVALGKLDMKSKQFTLLGRYSANKARDPSSTHASFFCADSLFFLARDSAYFKEKDCLVRMELDSGQTSRILSDGSLPISTLSDIEYYEGKLYLGMKNHLARCNPDGSDVEILAAARRAQTESELDNKGGANGWTIHGMALDGKADRLMFPVKFRRGGDGVFACDLRTDEIKRIKARPMTVEGKSNIHSSFIWYGNMRMTLDDEGRVFVRNNRNGTFLLEPEKATLDLYFGSFYGFRYAAPLTSRSKKRPNKAHDSALVEKDGFLIHSDGIQLFQIIGPKSPDKAMNPRWDLEMPDHSSPVFLTKHEKRIVAVTRNGVWLMDLRHPALSGGSTAVKESKMKGVTGRLTVRSPVGGTLRLDKEEPYRFWPHRPLNWSRVPVGRHRIEFDWCGRKWNQTFTIEKDKRTDITIFAEAGIEKKMILDSGNGIKMKFTWIPPGKGKIGDKAKNELEPVRINQGFWMGIYEVTIRQFRTIMDLPGADAFHGHRYPATSVSWEQANEFCRRMTKEYKSSLDGNVVRLPMEDEWEYACRAGTETLYYTGNTRESMATARQSMEKPPLFETLKGARLEYHCAPVGLRTPNLFGLHNMCSNVSEWCMKGTEDNVGSRRFGLTGRYRSVRSWRGRKPCWHDGFRVVIANP